MTKKLIALDCDGVLLDYNEAYSRVWLDFYGTELKPVNLNSYHAENYYGIKWPSIEEREIFFKYFNQKGWGMMNALPKAIEATQLLRKSGYKIVVVTSMAVSAQQMRHDNLIRLGFAVDETISTGRKIDDINPKKVHIEKLNPDYFVDDLIENFHDIQSNTHLVLIDLPADDSPNLSYKGKIDLHSKHTALWDFVTKHIV